MKNKRITGLDQPWNVEVDTYGNVYVVDRGTDKVLKYDIDCDPINSFNSNNYINYIEQIDDNLSDPLDVAINSENNKLRLSLAAASSYPVLTDLPQRA